MRYHTCECGNLEMWTSGMAPFNCRICQACNTTYGGGEPEDHEWMTLYNERAGDPYEMCTTVQRAGSTSYTHQHNIC